MTKEERSKEQEKVTPEEEEAVFEKGEMATEPIEAFDEDEKDLFEKLMKKIVDAGDLEKELDNDLESFEERVGSVVDSVDRIEKFEKASIESLIYKHDEEEIDIGQTTEGPEKKVSRTDRKKGPVVKPTPVPEGEKVFPIKEDPGFGHIYLPTDSPYDQIKKGEIGFDHKGEFLDTYGTEVISVLQNIFKLIKLKIEKEDLDKARELFMLSASIGGGSDYFQSDFVPLADILDVELPLDHLKKEKTEANVPSIDEKDETEVLEPELVGEIESLQKKASSAIKQLEKLIETSDLIDDELKRIKVQHLRSVDLYREKRFHKSYGLALEALGTLKNHIADGIDNRLQNDLYRTKEMLEDYSREGGASDPDNIEELRTTLDRAMKAYLTNEFEKATLLAKKVMNTILDSKGDTSEPLRKEVEELKKELNSLKELNIPIPEINLMIDAIRSVEHLLDRHDLQNAERTFLRIKDLTRETREKSQKFISARELNIKLNNRMERLRSSGFDLSHLKKKIDFVHQYFKEERYDDILVIGLEIEHELDVIEDNQRENISKNILESLEEVMVRVVELDDPDTYKNAYDELMETANNGDIQYLRTKGQELIDTIKGKLRTVKVERAKRITSSVVEGRILSGKLRSFKIDTTDHDRNLRKARTLIREGKHQEGIDLMESTIDLMKKISMEKVEYFKEFMNIYRDSLEVVMDRHKEEPRVYYIKRKQIPILRKMEELGNYHNALEHYRTLESRFADVITTEDKKESVENDLNKVKFEIYKKKEEGMDISEPLSLYTLAQKRYGEGQVVPAEFLIEVGRRYCETFMLN
ncbi:MAG: hypothetical protein JXA22_09600 [Candidatus Thermoplasmatota archaeon]|nr:hypothetical protein [Candidatus Thermoplasmatota archaeon]